MTYNMFKSGETNDKLLKRHTLHDNFQTRGHNRKLSKEHCRLDIRKNSFSQRIVNTWNSLPSNIVQAKNTNTFKRLFDNHYVLYHVVVASRVWENI